MKTNKKVIIKLLIGIYVLMLFASISKEAAYASDLGLFTQEEQPTNYIVSLAMKSVMEEESKEETEIESHNLVEEKLVEKKQEEKKKDKPKDKPKAKKKKAAYTEKELRLLSSLVYSEAGNQSYEGMKAVANVVINRAKSDIYWHVDTIEEVIYDNKWAVQFSVTKARKSGKSILDDALKGYDTGVFSRSKNQKAEQKAMERATKAAKDALEGSNNIGKYTCFRVNNNGASTIKKKYSNYKVIGDHIFYRTK